jgi:hypothetical protein
VEDATRETTVPKLKGMRLRCRFSTFFPQPYRLPVNQFIDPMACPKVMGCNVKAYLT